MLLLSSADFFKINFLKKNLSGALSEWQTVWIQIRTGSILFAKIISRQQVAVSKETVTHACATIH